MLADHALATATISTVPPTAFVSMPRPDLPVAMPEPAYEVTHSAICMDGSNLWREPTDTALVHVIEAIRLAELRGKSELVMLNITPWIKIRSGEITNVPETQELLEGLLTRACNRLKCDMPEIRLTLRGGEFDLRCYLGREKPSDHVFEDDWTSDSR